MVRLKKEFCFCLLFILGILFIYKNQIFADNRLLINEFLANPSKPNKEWVEFYNPDHLDLSSYFLDDDTSFTSDSGSSAKKSLANSITSGDYAYLEFSSFLNNSGDSVVLFDKDGNLVDNYQYNQDPGIDIAIGRSPDHSGNFAILAQATKGSPNSEALPTLTSTPAPTVAPTHIPTSTRTPTSILTPTLKPSATSTQSKSPTQSASSSLTKLNSTSDSAAATNDALAPVDSSPPDFADILGAENSQNLTPVTDATPATTSHNSLVYMLVGIGVIFFIACGILFFKSWKRKQPEIE